jgi:hypothetical protein
MSMAMWRLRERQWETEAALRAEEYAAVDPFYEGKPLTSRERALVRLAIRAFTQPEQVDREVKRLGDPTG